jgi:arylsulfatase A-like enzyme
MPTNSSHLERRDVLKGFAGASALWPTTLGARQQSANTAGRPNILYIHSHDTGRQIQPYGKAVLTPNLQKLATQGVLFRNAHSAAPTCSPSRASLLSGQCAHSSGMLGLAHRGFSMNDYRQHVLYTLRAAGYTSILGGLQHIAKDPKTIGYDQIVHSGSTHVAQVAPTVVQFLKNAPKEPFFLDVGFFETHRPFLPPGPQDDERYNDPAGPLPDLPATRRDMAGFQSSVRTLDQGVGDVLNALEAAGLAENTLVINTTDHGISFPSMKCNLTRFGTGVLLMMRGPGGFSGGKVTDALVSHVDIFPTLCELLELPPPAWLQGRSFLPIVRGKTQDINEQVYAEVTYHAAYEPKRSVISRRWNYIRHFGDRHTPVLPNCDDGLSKGVWLEYGWRDRAVAREQLYDLIFDPNETHNLANDPAYADAKNEMSKKLDSWMHSTNDPILKGPVPAPHGAEVNDPNGTSPQEPTQHVS